MTGREGSDDEVFRERTRRDRLFGLWAARQLGLDGGSALVYAAEVTEADAEGGEGRMVAKVVADLEREESSVDPATVERRLRDCEHQARQHPPD